ncbi:hypothetical protein BJX64DRAFT_165818 [Aspergillus heterothallicus]
MKVSHLILTSLAVLVNSTAAVQIFTGEQINDGVNYAVAWGKGVDTCRGRLLAPVTENPCDKSFWYGNVYYHLGNCGTNDFGLYKADGSRVGPCNRVKDVKYTCGSGAHDTIKHCTGLVAIERAL